MNMLPYIHESNLIENIKSLKEDEQSLTAWGWLEKQEIIEQPELLHLHKLVTVNQLEKHESGHYREVNVMVGGRVCPTPFLAQEQIHNWLLDLAEHYEALDPRTMHIRYEKIHPFVDGNGRTGRMLMWWHETKLGLSPTLILDKEKKDYYKWFK